MSKSISQVLGWIPLCGKIQSQTDGIPNPLPDSFFTTSSEVEFATGVLVQYGGQRLTSTRSEYGSASRKVALKEIGRRPVKLLHSFEHVDIELETMLMLQSQNSYEQDKGRKEIERQVEIFKKRFINLKIAATLLTLANGIVYFDDNGNLLHSSSGSAFSLDFGMNAYNQTTGLMVDGVTPLISGDWATATTDIMGDLRRIKKTAARRTGYKLKYAFYGEEVPGFLATNNSVKEFFFRNPGMQQHYLDTGELPNIGGFTWIPAYEGFYEKYDNTNKDLWTSDLVVFTPEPEENWWDMMKGGFRVPKQYGFSTDINGAIDSTERVGGMFSYAEPIHNPPGCARLHAGDTFLPALKVADCVFQMDVS